MRLDKFAPMQPDYTISELATLTNSKEPHLSRLAREGRLPGAYKLGGQWRIVRSVFDAHRASVLGSTGSSYTEHPNQIEAFPRG